jgi:hypothetical protein
MIFDENLARHPLDGHLSNTHRQILHEALGAPFRNSRTFHILRMDRS